jgi:hypothetical protein
MPDITVQMTVDGREQAAMIRDRIQRGLQDRGSIQMGAEPGSLPGHHRGPSFVLTGVIVCDEPASDAVAVVRRVLPEFEVTEVPVLTGEDARLTIVS